MKTAYEIKDSMNTEQVKNAINLINGKEKELFELLVYLGDSKEIAIATVICERQKPDNSEFYSKAYEN